MKLPHFLSFALFLFVIGASADAWAVACSSTDSGNLKWRGDGATDSVFYCDGAVWQNTDHGVTATACVSATDAGTIQYGASIYRFCGADNFYHTMKGSNIGTCSAAGQATYNGVDWVWCDGAILWSMNPNLICVVTLTTAGSTTWAGKTSFATPNVIRVVGGGGGGGSGNNTDGGSGGGGGSYSFKSNVSMTFPAIYNVGAGGTAATTTNGNGTVGGDTWICSNNAACASINGANVLAGAKGGSPGIGASAAGTGTSVTLNIPAGSGSTGGSGVVGAGNIGNRGGGGGGAGGPNGAGNAGSNGTGGQGDGTTGGAGGANAIGGGTGTEWGGGIGSGGGGGGGISGTVNGAIGGPYGGGGGGPYKGNNQTAGAGYRGAIYIQWTSSAGNCN